MIALYKLISLKCVNLIYVCLNLRPIMSFFDILPIGVICTGSVFFCQSLIPRFYFEQIIPYTSISRGMEKDCSQIVFACKSVYFFTLRLIYRQALVGCPYFKIQLLVFCMLVLIIRACNRLKSRWLARARPVQLDLRTA